MRLEPLAVPAPFAVDYAPGQGAGPLVIAFSSIGHDPARMPEPEFLRSATHGGRAALFVRDQSRSWANAPGFAPMLRQALAEAQARAPVTRIVTLGLSMGGFCALAAASILPVDAVLAIGPQFSVVPELIDDSRWRDWTARIDRFHLPTCPVPDGPWLCLFHGLADDAAQAMAFPQRKGLDHFLFDGLTHGALGPHLKQAGHQGLVDALVAGDRRRLVRIATAAGGQRRQLPR